MNIKPILLGKLGYIEKECYTLTGYLGDTECITGKEYEILKLMDGFNTINDIAKKANVQTKQVECLFSKYENTARKVIQLEDWNKTSWCSKCKIYYMGENCGFCNQKGEKLFFSPPCDPWMALSVEKEYVLRNLRKRFDINVSDDCVLLINNGVHEGKFFWEVAYGNKLILKINFEGYNEEQWKFELLKSKEEILQIEPMIWNEISKERFISANRIRQEQLYLKAKSFIYETNMYFNELPLLYFSGGKESMVMLSLLERLKIKANVITVAGGVEFPEDYNFMKKCVKKIEHNNDLNMYFYQEDGKSIMNEIQEKGRLTIDDPWCRVKYKRELKIKAVRDIYGKKEFVAYEGSRWYENDFRRRHPKIQILKDYPYQLWAHPIAEWTYMDVWIYLLENKISINPMYYKGYQRTTCWMCPIVNPFHLLCSKKQYPNLWEQIKECEISSAEDSSYKEFPY